MSDRTFIRDKTYIFDLQFVIDAQGKYVTKELGVLDLNGSVAKQWIFKPTQHFKDLPYFIQKRNWYITRHIHGLEWYSGDQEITRLPYILSTYTNCKIIVKGRSKKEVLEEIYKRSCISKKDQPKIVDLADSFSLNNRLNYKHNCVYHQEDFKQCVLNNVFKIRSFVEQECNLL